MNTNCVIGSHKSRRSIALEVFQPYSNLKALIHCYHPPRWSAWANFIFCLTSFSLRLFFLLFFCEHRYSSCLTTSSLFYSTRKVSALFSAQRLTLESASPCTIRVLPSRASLSLVKFTSTLTKSVEHRRAELNRVSSEPSPFPHGSSYLIDHIQ